MTENAIQNRYEFIILYDVENGNPNGDPDAGNMPRIDPETGHGIVTDVCIKRKIRNYIDLAKNCSPGYDIYIKQDAVLNRQDLLAGEPLDMRNDLEYIQNSSKEEAKKRGKALKSKVSDVDKQFRDYMCNHFFDIRTFGAVMTTFVKAALNCGQVRGPVQLAFGRSIDPIVPQEVTITRVAITTEKDADKKDTEMGRKHIVPYGLYRQEGFISANLAQRITGFSEDDLKIFWQAIIHMFEEDRSAARGKMTLRELIVFKHESNLGNAPAQKLFDLVSVVRKEGSAIARHYEDYLITVDTDALPDGVTLERKV
jgi:CRISPR-associated protein Csd2